MTTQENIAVRMGEVLEAINSAIAAARAKGWTPPPTLPKAIDDLRAGKVALEQWLGLAMATVKELVPVAKADVATGSFVAKAQQAISAMESTPPGLPPWLLPIGVLGVAGLACWTYSSMKNEQMQGADIDIEDVDMLDGVERVKPIRMLQEEA